MKSLKWRVLIGCFVSYMFDSMEIIVLTIAMPILMNSIKMSPSEAGLLVTATLIGIGASSVVLGSYSDNFGRRKSLLLSIIIFGGFTAAIAVTNAWWQILVLRFLAGLGLGGLWAIASTYVAETWPAAQRGRAVAFVLSSFPVGGGLAALIAAAVLPTYGWRALFLVCGGAVATAVVYVYFCVPESPAWEARSVLRDKATAQQSVSMREIFAPELLRRTLLGTMASTFALTAYWGAATWLPTYLVRERGLSVHSMAMFITLLSVGQFIGYHVFGYIADVIGKKRAIILSFVGTTITLPIYAVTTDHVTLFWLGPVYSFLSPSLAFSDHIFLSSSRQGFERQGLDFASILAGEYRHSRHFC